MLIIPAIDLKDGACVRLEQGRMDSATVFSKEPSKAAAQWVEKGARRLHVVDLNGAVAGKPRNESAVKEIIAAVDSDVPVQLGGGIRDLETIERYLDDGVSFVIIGTAAVKNPGFLHEACDAFPGHVIVGLDAKDGKVATDGWSKLTGHDVVDLAKRFQDYGVEAVIYTDIGRDGMMTGVNIEATVRLARALSVPVIACGGLAKPDHVRRLLNAGADKVSINTAAVENPELVEKSARRFGSQAIVVAIDARSAGAGRWEVYTHGGRKARGLDAVEWARTMAARGAGEILLTSMDRDGTKSGFDLALTRALSDAVPVPVIASGGVGRLEHLAEGIEQGRADALLAASVFHFGQITVADAKRYLAGRGLELRL